MLFHAILITPAFAAEAPATQPAANTVVEVGSVAPDATLTVSDGGIYKLSDLTGAETIERYGILKPSGDNLPHPTALVIDKKGVVH